MVQKRFLAVLRLTALRGVAKGSLFAQRPRGNGGNCR
jgi:hypothetical protein